MPLNTNRLRLLRELSQRGTIAAVAEALYLSPPAVSHQLAVLEQEVGVPLLERTARSVRLTDVGMRLVAHADRILADCEAALADIAALAEQVTGTVRISTFQTAAQTIALPAMVDLAARYPNLEVTALDVEPVRALPDLKSGLLDITLSHEWDFVAAVSEPGLGRLDLLAEPVVALLPRSHPLAGSPIRLSQLADDRWCVAHESASSRQAVERAAHAAGFEPRIVLESNYFRALGSAVESGIGVGIAPAMTDLRGLDIDVQPLVEPRMSRRIFAAYRLGSEDAPRMRAVLDALHEAARHAAEPPGAVDGA